MYTSRLDELNRLLQEADLNLLSRRLIDFLIDFPNGNTVRNQAIALRARYNLEISAVLTGNESLKQALLTEAEHILAGLAQRPVPVAATRQRQVVVSTRGITKTFSHAGFRFTLPAIDLTLYRGTITGVVGENGNGKTTLLRLLAGELSADGGELTYPALNGGMDWAKIRRRIAFIPQYLEPWPGKLKQQLQYTTALHGILGEENEDLVTLMIHRLGLSRYQHASWKEISSGYRLRFELARALLCQPDLLVIDEPLANLDLNTQQVFMQDMRYLASAAHNPPALVLTSQHLHEVEKISDHLVFLRNGQLLFNGPRSDFAIDRSHNLFELSTDMPAAALLSIPGFPLNWDVKEVHQVILLETPTGVSAGEVLKLLLEAGVAIRYFRDISTSVLRLFRESD